MNTRALAAVFSAGWRRETAYRLPLVNDAFATTLIIVLTVTVWAAVFRERGGAAADGFTPTGMTTYLVMANLLALLLANAVDGRLDEEIRRGDQLAGMVRPVSYPVLHAALGLATVLVRLVCVALPLGLIGAVLLDLHVPSPGDAALGLLAAAIATTMGIVLGLIVGLVGLVTVSSWGIRHLYTNVVIVLSGQLLPLQLLPDAIRRPVEWLPFASMVSVPTRLLLGRYAGPAEATFLILQQVGWLAVLVGLSTVVWRAAAQAAVNSGG